MVTHLGTVDQTVLIFGGPYGNLEATSALFAEAERLHIPDHRIICTGDVVAYCADPQATVDLIRARNIAVVQGNCEESLARRADDCGCGFEDGTACQSLADQWYAHADAHLTDDARIWMGRLPERIDLTLGGKRLAVIHGGVSVINQFVFASDGEGAISAELDLAGTDGVIGGHCGLPFSKIVGSRLWHNSGALGMPANDGTPRVWFSLVSPDADGLLITHHALSYDHRTAAAKIRAAGLPRGYADCLETGRWPSLDVLPDQEKSKSGEPLSLPPVYWPASRLAGAA